MAILLHIDTAVETASICISEDDRMIAYSENQHQVDHASWLHNAINSLLHEVNLTSGDLNAVALSIGPGSYTGLRVGLSAAKGLCFALGIPLITLSTLEIMAASVNKETADLFCPVIDARRMEIYTAVYDKRLIEIIKPCSLILDAHSFNDLLKTSRIIFFGNGINKLQNVLSHNNAIFLERRFSATDMASLASRCFNEKTFANLAYSEPFYIKEFYFPVR